MLKEKRGMYTEHCLDIYQTVYNNAVNLRKQHVIFSHFGIFSQDLINSITDSVEDIMISSGDKKQLTKRIFSVLIEGLQNIRIHSKYDEKKMQLSHLVLSKDDAKYLISFGNLIASDLVDTMSKRLANLNALTDAEVKTHYMDILSNGEISDKGGAGLGFITMRMKADTALKSTFFELENGLTYFTLEFSFSRE